MTIIERGYPSGTRNARLDTDFYRGSRVIATQPGGGELACHPVEQPQAMLLNRLNVLLATMSEFALRLPGGHMKTLKTGLARSARREPRGPDTMDAQSHWEQVYTTKRPTEVRWYRPHLETSLRFANDAAGGRDAGTIDPDGNESALLDDFVNGGHRNVSALVLLSTALAGAKGRLGAAGGLVQWICDDVIIFDCSRHRYTVWHERAVFHFLTDEASRARYVRQPARAVTLGGHVIVATFGPEGPTKCSRLDVVRYDPDALHGQFRAAFTLEGHLSELYRTPSGSIQQFTHCYCRVASELA